jgi:dihydroxyacid dehydratase/phosphogluconate dehydratase
MKILIKIHYLQTGGVVGLKGNLAPDGGIVKIAGLKEITIYW